MTSKLVSKMSYLTYTENDMLTYKSSENPELDLFFKIGAPLEEKELYSLLNKSLTHNPNATMRILAWSRDIISGAGRRSNYINSIKGLFGLFSGNIKPLSDFTLKCIELGIGYWKDAFKLMLNNKDFDAIVKAKVAKAIEERNTKPTLLFKWLPRQGKIANYLRGEFTPKQWRKILVDNSETVEQLLCAKEFDKVEYSKVPSIAFAKYSKKCFPKNDSARFKEFLGDVISGKNGAKVNAKAIWPHEVLKQHGIAREAQWKCLPNWLENAQPNFYLPICDVSGSMAGTPREVSYALGLYISERNIGQFKDAFITFSAHPQMMHLSGSLDDRIREIADTDEAPSNTNLQKTFEIILKIALENKISEEEMPKCLLIISDMQFDQGTNGYENSNAQRMVEQLYSQSGYKMPDIVYWNVRNSNGIPVEFTQKGTALISGYSPSILKAVISAQDLKEADLTSKKIDPMVVMNQAIMSERYNFVDEIWSR